MRRRWPQVPARQWNDWRWQLAHQVRGASELDRFVHLTQDERLACSEKDPAFGWAISPYYASLIDPDDPTDPVRRQAIPTGAELVPHPEESADPLAEDEHSPVKAITHRYPDRAVLYATGTCAMYCRHCNRRRKVGSPASSPSGAELKAALTYLRAHSEIRDVIVSGGDPLSLPDARLIALLSDLRAVPHLEIVRIATRYPATLPQRITGTLASRLRALAPLYVNTQFNHLKECTPEAARALDRLADAGCVLGNQMVLLRGINEDPQMVKAMNRWLLLHRCRPYYIFQCDPALGTAHFRTPIESGLEILRALIGWTSGLAVPHYVVDLPGGGGKVPLVPEYLISHQGHSWMFRNYAGRQFTYVEGAPAKRR